jgi:hypothetical protein
MFSPAHGRNAVSIGEQPLNKPIQIPIHTKKRHPELARGVFFIAKKIYACCVFILPFYLSNQSKTVGIIGTCVLQYG